MEDWSDVALEPTYVYGIRTYYRGSKLEPHRDRENTHIISAILNISQQVDEEWPLEIEDHMYRKHRIFLRPGEMLLYEGGRLQHGRPSPLQGSFFANIFVHYKPKAYNYFLKPIFL